MAVPTSVEGREVGFGGGPAMAAYVATRRAMGYEPVVVVDNGRTLGGVFAKLVKFDMNSAMNASVASTGTPGPTRIRPMSPSDDLNYIPNSMHQVRDQGMSEYPDSFAMARTVRLTLKEYAECYTSADLLFDASGAVFTKGGQILGRARRIIFAGGTVPRPGPRGPAIKTGFDFLQDPVRDLENKKIAVIGNGATAAQCVEIMLGDSYMKPVTLPSNIHWFGGPDMPDSKSAWMEQYHVRFSGLGRHFPQSGIGGGVIRPYPLNGELYSAGNIAIVNEEVFDLVLWCAGVVPATSFVTMTSRVRIGGMTVGLSSGTSNPLGGRVFTIGTAAGIDEPYKPVLSRFPAANNALYVNLPRVAALAGSLPR